MRNYRVVFWQILMLVWITLLPILMPANAYAELSPPALTGTVLGKNNQPKKYIRVEIKGNTNIKLATNADGEFKTSLPAGDYIVVIRQRSRQMEFEVTINKDSITTKTFNLAW